jgi:hypothetical protein
VEQYGSLDRRETATAVYSILRRYYMARMQEEDAFLRQLRYSQRWLKLENIFTYRIFALLPLDCVPSTYVERSLSIPLFDF